MKTLLSIALVAGSLSSCILMPEYWDLKEQQQIQPGLSAVAAQKTGEVQVLKGRVDKKKAEVDKLNASIRRKQRQIEELRMKQQQALIAAAQDGAVEPDDLSALRAEIEKKQKELEKLQHDVDILKD